MKPAVVAVGIVTFSALATFFKAFSVVATGIASLSTVFTPSGDAISKVINIIAVGIPTAVRKMFKTVAVVATGTPTEVHGMKFLESFAVVATGAASSVQRFLLGTGKEVTTIRLLVRNVWRRVYHGVGRVLLTHHHSPTFFLDNFIDPDGTDISAHTPEFDTSIAGWTERNGSVGSITAYDLVNDSVPAGQPRALYTAEIGLTDVDISAATTRGGAPVATTANIRSKMLAWLSVGVPTATTALVTS